MFPCITTHMESGNEIAAVVVVIVVLVAECVNESECLVRAAFIGELDRQGFSVGGHHAPVGVGNFDTIVGFIIVRCCHHDPHSGLFLERPQGGRNTNTDHDGW